MTEAVPVPCDENALEESEGALDEQRSLDPGDVEFHDLTGCGRPTKYKPRYCEKALALYQAGATDEEVADAFRVYPKTVRRWAAVHPEFAAVRTLAKEVADERVERSLYQRAIGYEQPAVKIMQFEGVPMAVRYLEHVPPDVAAAQFWLTNRKPKEWKQTKTVELKNDRTEIEAIDAILAKFARLRQGVLVEGELQPAPARLTHNGSTNGHGR